MTINEPLEIQMESFLPSNVHLLRDYRFTESVNVSIANGHGRITVLSTPKMSRALHTFTVEASDFGYSHSSGMDSVQDLLAISCSLSSQQVLFSTAHIDRLGWKVCDSLLKTEGQTGLSNITASIPCSLAEADIISTASKLKALGFGGVLSSNLLEAIDCYRLALNAGNPEMMFAQLYACTDKLANSNRSVPLTGAALDQEISRLGGISVQEVESLRTCANRFKHPANTSARFTELKNCKSKLHTSLPLLADLTTRLLKAAI